MKKVCIDASKDKMRTVYKCVLETYFSLPIASNLYNGFKSPKTELKSHIMNNFVMPTFHGMVSLHKSYVAELGFELTTPGSADRCTATCSKEPEGSIKNKIVKSQL